jgi:hypothetical protein
MHPLFCVTRADASEFNLMTMLKELLLHFLKNFSVFCYWFNTVIIYMHAEKVHIKISQAAHT